MKSVGFFKIKENSQGQTFPYDDQSHVLLFEKYMKQ